MVSPPLSALFRLMVGDVDYMKRVVLQDRNPLSSCPLPCVCILCAYCVHIVCVIESNTTVTYLAHADTDLFLCITLFSMESLIHCDDIRFIRFHETHLCRSVSAGVCHISV